MVTISCVALLALLAVVSGATNEYGKEIYDLNDAPELFEKFQKDFNRTYKDAADKEIHYQAFIKGLKEINELNSKQSTANFGITNFTDYTPEEMEKMHGYRPKNH